MQGQVRDAGRAADDAGGGLNVFGADGVGDIRGGQAAFGDLLRIEPDAHGVFTAAEHLDRADALDGLQAILDVEQGVVTQVVDVITAVGRGQVDHQRQGGL